MAYTSERCVREAAKKEGGGLRKPQKNYFLSTKRGWGLNGCATKINRTFFTERKKVPMATKPRRGLKALVAGPLRK